MCFFFFLLNFQIIHHCSEEVCVRVCVWQTRPLASHLPHFLCFCMIGHFVISFSISYLARPSKIAFDVMWPFSCLFFVSHAFPFFFSFVAFLCFSSFACFVLPFSLLFYLACSCSFTLQFSNVQHLQDFVCPHRRTHKHTLSYTRVKTLTPQVREAFRDRDRQCARACVCVCGKQKKKTRTDPSDRREEEKKKSHTLAMAARNQLAYQMI